MPETSFEKAYPLARRAAQVRAIAAVASGRARAADREDLEQEALLRIWQALPRYDPSKGSLGTFIERVAESRFRSLLRSRRHSVTIEPLDGMRPASADGIPMVEFRTDFERLLRLVGGPERRLASLLTVHSASEAGRILGVARSTVYRRIERLRAALLAAGYGPSGCPGGKR